MLNFALNEHIFVNTAISHTYEPCDSSTGQADILAELLPALSVQKTHGIRTLNKVDDYMLLETKRLLEKLRSCFKQKGISDGTECQLVLENQALVLTGESTKFQALTQLINRDNWLVGAFSWLQPNFVGLVHSIEWLDFSVVYAKDKTRAIQAYTHFDHYDHGLRCQLRYDSGLLHMIWQSPSQRFYVDIDNKVK